MSYLSILNAVVRISAGEDVSDTSIIANKCNIRPNLANALPAVEGASIGDYMGEHNINTMFGHLLLKMK